MRPEKIFGSLLIILAVFPAFSCSTSYYRFLAEDYTPVTDLNESLLSLYLNSPGPVDYSFISSFCTISPKFSSTFFRYFLSRFTGLHISPTFSTFLASFSRKLLSEEAYSYYEAREIMRLAISYGLTYNLTCSRLEPFIYNYYTYGFETYIDDVCNRRRQPYRVLRDIEELVNHEKMDTMIRVGDSEPNNAAAQSKAYKDNGINRRECVNLAERVLFSLPACFPGSDRLKKEMALEICSFNPDEKQLLNLLENISMAFLECKPFEITLNNSSYILLAANSSGFFFLDLTRKNVIFYPPEYTEHINKIFKEKAKEYLKSLNRKNKRTSSDPSKRSFRYSYKKVKKPAENEKLSTAVIFIAILIILLLVNRRHENV